MNDDVKLKPCPLCGGKMRIGYTSITTDEIAREGYYVRCNDCSLFFGLNEEDAGMGLLVGGYSNDETVALEWNARRANDD